MKPAEVSKLLLDGAALVILEYRRFGVDEKIITSKKTGRKESRVIVTHGCEGLTGQPIIVEEWMPEGTDRATLKAPFEKGSKVVLRIASFDRDGAAFRARGEFKPLE